MSRYWKWIDELLPFTRATGNGVEVLDGDEWITSCHTVEMIEAYNSAVECDEFGQPITKP